MTRPVPDDSLASLRRATKRITMMVAGYLAYKVAVILREILTHPTKQLYADTTAHLLCSVTLQCNFDRRTEKAVWWACQGDCTSKSHLSASLAITNTA